MNYPDLQRDILEEFSAAQLGKPGIDLRRGGFILVGMSKAVRGFWRPKIGRPERPIVDQYGTRYRGAEDAAQKLGLKPANVTQVLRGLRARAGSRKRVGGYVFRYT